MHEQTDHGLIERAKRGDSEAFSRLVERYYSTMFRVAYKWCGDQSDAEDIAQDVCVKLGHAIRGFKGTSAFSSWLYRVTLNAVHDHQRARQRQTQNIAAMALVVETEHVPDMETEMTQDQLWTKVRDLPAKQRDAVMLIFGEDMSHREAADIMDCAESTVSWHIHEAKKRLKGMLEG
jgi:RNA polymerase sigma-70 factor (ECF subfamily)